MNGLRLHDDLAWTLGVLWPGAEVERARSVGYATHVVVPSLARPRCLLPAEPRAAAAALLAGNGLRPPRPRAARAALAGLLRTPAGRLAGDRIVVRDADIDLSASLCEVLGAGVLLAAGIRPPGPYRTPVVLGVMPEGDVLAYAKVAWSALTDRAVTREADALERSAGGGSLLRTPRPIARFQHQRRQVLVTHPMPRGLKRFDRSGPSLPLDHTRSVVALSEVGHSTVAESHYLGATRERLARVARAAVLPELSETADGLLDRLATRHAGTELAFGAWHGDWSPWNLARRGHELWAWDWEHADWPVPVGLDLPHFRFQVAFVSEGRSFSESARRAAEASADIHGLGASLEGVETTVALHLVELALRALEAEAEGARGNPRIVREAPSALRGVTREV